MSTKGRAWSFYVLLNILAIALTWWAADRIGILWLMPFMLSINVLILTYGQLLNFSQLPAEPLLGHDHWGLSAMVDGLSEKIGVARPEVLLLKSSTPQALVFGRSRNSSKLYLSEGLLNKLNRDEMEAILAQQLVILKSSAGVSFYLLGAIGDLLFRVGQVLDRAVAWVFGLKSQVSAWPATPFMWTLQKLLIPKNLYFKADAQASKLIDQPQALASALWKLDSYSRTSPLPSVYVWSHMCSVSPLTERKPFRWLRTQPSMKSRIKNLLGYFPI